MNRREFGAGLIAPLLLKLKESSTRTLKRFSEVSASLYAWDLLDEGTEEILDTLHETTGTNSVYLVALMHEEKRPLTDYYYPHDPKRKVYFPEDSRAYWRPHLEHYQNTKIKPRTSDRAEFKGRDSLEPLIAATRKRGWKTGAEISHTVLDRQRATTDYQFAVQRGIYGQPFGQLICPNVPDSRAYVIGLFTDLVKNYDLDFVQTCLIPFIGGSLRLTTSSGGFSYVRGIGGESSRPDQSQAVRILEIALGGCFCSSCEAAAKAQGLDLKAVQRSLLPLADMIDHPDPQGAQRLSVLSGSNTSATEMLLRHPELFDWMKFRCASFTSLFRDVHAAITQIKPNIDLRWNAYIGRNPEFNGVDLAAMKPFLGSVRSSDYSEQRGTLEALETKRKFLLGIRDAIGDDMLLISALGIRPKATPETVRKGVVVSSECGADGLGLGHYDGAPLHLLKAVRDGMADADATI
jgi:hypothetical protein